MKSKEAIKHIIFNQRKKGLSFSRIADNLNDMGHRSSSNKRWTAGLVFHAIDRFNSVDEMKIAIAEIEASSLSRTTKALAIKKMSARIL